MLGGTFQALIVPSAASSSGVPSANTLNDQGVQSWRVGRRSEAMATFTAACRADRSFAVPWHNRGAIYLTEGQFLHAVDDLKEAARLAPDWTLPRTHLAQAFLRTGDATAALAVSDAARALDPTLPDIRDELRGVLQMRLRMAGEIASRRLIYFIATLVLALVVTFVTAGIGLGALALPIYRFFLFSQARRARDTAKTQLRVLDDTPALRTYAPALPMLRDGASARPGPKGIVPYLVAGTLPPFSPAELETTVASGSGFRRAGWPLLGLSLIACASGIYLLVLSNSGHLNALDDGAAFLLGLGAIFCGALFASIAVLVGAVAALRRHRTGWALSILLLGAVGVFFFIVPAQVMTLAYLLFMPSGSTTRKLEFLPVPQVSLSKP